MRTEQAPTENPAEPYATPQIEVIDIELSQNIMGSGTLPGDGTVPGEDW